MTTPNTPNETYPALMITDEVVAWEMLSPDYAAEYLDNGGGSDGPDWLPAAPFQNTETDAVVAAGLGKIVQVQYIEPANYDQFTSTLDDAIENGSIRGWAGFESMGVVVIRP